MEAKIGGKRQGFCGPVVSDMKGVVKPKGSLEWDLNDWKWDGDLFVATTQSSSVSVDSRSTQCFDIRPEIPGSNAGLDCRSRQFFDVRPEVSGNAGFVSSSSYLLEDANVPNGDVRHLFPFRDEVLGNAGFVSGPSSRLEAGNVPNSDFNLQNSGSAGLFGGSSSRLEDANGAKGDVRRELEKRRRDVDVEDEMLHHEPGSLNLRLGRQDSCFVDEDVKHGKKSRVVGCSSSRAVCQVEDCRADLSNAKDYHRRHKVCDMHSKATQALVGNAMQRFCQQCSRFHVLQEFDEGKRSCRRRLAGHNRRRRKAHPDTVANASSANDGSSSNYILNSLLRILSNMQPSSSDQTRDQDLVCHLLKNLGGLAGSVTGGNLSELLQGTQGSQNVGTPAGTQETAPNVNSGGPALTLPSCANSNAPIVQNPLKITGECTARLFEQNRIASGTAQGGSSFPVPGLPATKLFSSEEGTSGKENGPENTTRKTQLNNIDLNSVYDGSQDHVENLERSNAPVNQTINIGYPSIIQRDYQKLSAPQTSSSSETTSTHSASTSSGETHSRTDRIVFKLFGKDPNDLPLDLRTKILGWLSNSPTDIESYIRPGCIILTIYLRLHRPSLEELCCNFRSNLKRLLDESDDLFWKMGWVYTRMQQTVAFIYNGQVVLDASLPLESHHSHRILSIKPIAVPASEKAEFIVKGVNLCHSTRLLCALGGKYLVKQPCDLLEGDDSLDEHNGLQHLRFDCTIPNVNGRGLVEVEDIGLGCSFCPFIVAEPEVCSEIRTLEYAIELAETAHDAQDGTEQIDVKNKALAFVDEMGWLLHRYHLQFRLGDMDPCSSLFSFNRFRWLLEFSMDHDWCAVVKKLLSIFLEGTIDSGEHSSTEVALSDMGLLHIAVRRKFRPMVELLLRFSPENGSHKQTTVQKAKDDSGPTSLFRPDARGPGGLTPLHLAASVDGSENVLDALTDDHGLIGLQAWQTARDDMGLTPNDYASMQGHHSYIHMVQEKIKKRKGHVVVDIPATQIDCNIMQNLSDGLKSGIVSNFDNEKIDSTIQKSCRLCQYNVVYGSNRTSLVYRPAVLSLLSIAVVCVCVALLFKSSPEVLFVLQPFRWEALKYGPV